MSRLTRDGKAEPVSRGTKFSGAIGDMEMFIFPVRLTTSRIGNLTRLIHTLLYVMTIHTYIHNIHCTVYPKLPHVIGAPRGCCGHASGISLPRPPWFTGCAPHGDSVLYARALLLHAVLSCKLHFSNHRELFCLSCLKKNLNAPKSSVNVNVNVNVNSMYPTGGGNVKTFINRWGHRL